MGSRSVAWSVALMLAMGCVSEPVPEVEEEVRLDVLGPTPLRRLTQPQYDHTVRDLLGIDLGLALERFAPDEEIGAFRSNAVAPVATLDVENYLAVAEDLSAAAVADLEALVPCAADADATCARAFAADFGRRAYRRPITPAEINDLVAVYETGETFADGIRRLVQAALQSPYFLYHLEPVPDGAEAIAPLDPYALANRLSYFLWSSMPDEQLFEAAATGGLSSPEGVREQAMRMVRDPRAYDTVASFHAQWLDLEELALLTKDPERFPQFDADLVAAMRKETARFADFVILKGDGSFEALMTSSMSFPTGPLAELYGLPASTNAPVDLGVQRSGILTHAGVMAAHAHANQTSPVKRGALLLQNVLCQPLPPPPEDVDNVPPDPDPSLTTRQRLAAHTENVECAGCHRLFDGLGFAFEHYDAIGAWRDLEDGHPIDATGTAEGVPDLGAFDGATELTVRLANSLTAQRCYATQWYRFAFGRVESPDDDGHLSLLYDAFEASGFNVRQLLVELAASQAFRNRRRFAPEAP